MLPRRAMEDLISLGKRKNGLPLRIEDREPLAGFVRILTIGAAEPARRMRRGL